jgi:hypothetical protein
MTNALENEVTATASGWLNSHKLKKGFGGEK